MKKLLAIVCCFAILLTLSACKKLTDLSLQTGATMPTLSPENTTENNEESPSEPDEPFLPDEGTVAQIPSVSCMMAKVTETYTAKDGTVLLEYIYPDTSSPEMLIMSDPQVADNIKIDIMNRIDDTISTKEDLLSQAKSAYNDSGAWTPYQYTIEYVPQRIDYSVLSFLTYEVNFNGYRPEKTIQSVNYSMITGQALSLYNILVEPHMSSQVCSLVIKALSEEKDQLFNDYADTIRDHFNEKINDDWYFSDKGLCFYFEPADIAPTALGTIVSEIPYEKLFEILRDEYFPAERATTSGKIEMVPFTVENIEKFTNFSDLILDEDGETILLYTQKATYHICIDIGTRTSDGEFQNGYSTFAQSSLTPGDALTICVNLSDEECLRIRYLSGQREVEVYLVRDTQSNSLALIS